MTRPIRPDDFRHPKYQVRSGDGEVLGTTRLKPNAIRVFNEHWALGDTDVALYFQSDADWVLLFKRSAHKELHEQQ